MNAGFAKSNINKILGKGRTGRLAGRGWMERVAAGMQPMKFCEVQK